MSTHAKKKKVSQHKEARVQRVTLELQILLSVVPLVIVLVLVSALVFALL